MVADSTGHGIPGALISILGMSLLNEIIDQDYIQTDIILNNLRDKIKKALNQQGKVGEHKDGWDLSIISLNIETGEAQYSGAFNSVYYIPFNKDESKKASEITARRCSDLFPREGHSRNDDGDQKRLQAVRLSSAEPDITGRSNRTR